MSGAANQPGPWLIAAWPGMGNVAVLAAGHLVRELDMKPEGELTAGDHFDIVEIQVENGLVAPVHRPRGLFFRWSNPAPNGRDLIVFLGEAQPSHDLYGYAHELLDAAASMGVERVICFASLATMMRPSADARVTGIATDAASMDELRRAEVEPMADGQIGGLNGLLLAAAAERGLPGVCLLAQIPFFAVNVPNPRGARAALSVFSVLTGIDVNLEMLTRQASAVDRMLQEIYEKLAAQGAFDQMGGAERAEEESQEEGAGEEAEEASDDTAAPESAPASRPAIDAEARRRIEALFEEARRDQSRAVALKQELDRLGVFAEYEDRFLDLFRRAG